MKYYSTQRPITPGSYPKPAFNQVTAILNYDSRTYCEGIGREAWGYWLEGADGFGAPVFTGRPADPPCRG